MNVTNSISEFGYLSKLDSKIIRCFNYKFFAIYQIYCINNGKYERIPI